LQVWITRSRPGADRDAAALTAAGYPVLVAPVIEVVATAAAAPQADFQQVIFLSEHAVRHSRTLAFCAGARVHAVGPATARALSERGQAASVAERHSSEGLVATLTKGSGDRDLVGQNLLIVAGEGGRKTLEGALERAGARVTEYLCYRRQGATRLPALPGSITDILIGSQDGFRRVARLWFDSGGPADVRIIVASARIAAIGDELGFSRVSLAAGAAPDDWVVALNDRRGHQ
jgi:uroporphyrinogen-III synthase